MTFWYSSHNALRWSLSDVSRIETGDTSVLGGMPNSTSRCVSAKTWISDTPMRMGDPSA
jgi:hypothetical protein